MAPKDGILSHATGNPEAAAHQHPEAGAVSVAARTEQRPGEQTLPDPAEFDFDYETAEMIPPSTGQQDTQRPDGQHADTQVAGAAPLASRTERGNSKRSVYDRIEAWISRLSTRNNFWHRVTSLIWLPFAFRSGIRVKRIDPRTFTAVLPFRRFNRNWYNAMAGAALLGNSEIAGGMYVFGMCGGDYTVVCKHLEYKFLRPCLGPAIYRIQPRDDLERLIVAGGEFNITIDMDVVQQIAKPGDRERRVGRASATFHVTPKLHQKAKRAQRDKARG